MAQAHIIVATCTRCRSRYLIRRSRSPGTDACELACSVCTTRLHHSPPGFTYVSAALVERGYIAR